MTRVTVFHPCVVEAEGSITVFPIITPPVPHETPDEEVEKDASGWPRVFSEKKPHGLKGTTQKKHRRKCEVCGRHYNGRHGQRFCSKGCGYDSRKALKAKVKAAQMQQEKQV